MVRFLLMLMVTVSLGFTQQAIAEDSVDYAPLGEAEEPEQAPLQGDVHVVINIPSRTLAVWKGEDKLREFSVGVGRAAFPTPIGQFSVLNKVENPLWEDPFFAQRP